MENFFKGISFSSICAGALAAVTSFLLSAKIGIAGSVIGVAAGSVVSAVATQVYKNVLKASGEKLQQAVPLPSSSDEASDEPAADETQVLGSSAKGDETRIIGSSPVASDATMVLSADTVAIAPSGLPRVISSGQEDEDATRTLGDIAGAGKTPVVQDGQRGVGSASIANGKSAARSARGVQVQHAGRRSSNWLHSKYAPAIIAFVSALVGVGVSAGLILAFTGGQGTDTVVRNVVHEKVVPSHENTGDSGSGNEQVPAQKPKSDSTDSNDETTTDGSGKTTSGSTDSPTSNGTSGNTTNGSTSGSSGSSSDNSSNGPSQTGTDPSNGTGSNGSTSGTTGDGSSSGTGSSGTDGSTGTGTSGSTDGTAGSTGDASSN
ncbi:hypothetical protein [Bifidobacterium sp. N5G01]|uniref:hypothetical protein n=1 Tax=Bifidobacterium sp. N5G01 TaxID=2013021 RepID=UPI000C14B8F2|nr:hypothetical protein [Bifidobacterium sp. N5G01]PIB81108.1 hypothetical protein CE168_08825 [Bifidobacterium sp. N5G01]